MRIDLEPEGGGMLLAGDDEEISGLIETLEEAQRLGEASASFLTKEGVEDFRILCFVGADGKEAA